MAEAKCKEVLVSASVGGKVEIVKYEYYNDYHFSISRTYDVPEEWTEPEVDEFQRDKIAELRAGILEGISQDEVDMLMDQREGLK